MSLADNLQNIDLNRLAQEIVQDTTNELKDEVDVKKMLNLLKQGNSPTEIAMQLNEDLNLVETLKAQAKKNVMEELGMKPETSGTSSSSTGSSSSTATSSGSSSTDDKVKDNKIRREDIQYSEMPMSNKPVDRDKIQFDDE